ncbi:hypothetical protein CKO28_08090 [Rhodovibrio sodomensis]|uniref:Zinc finger/thioredoxin putative domain-containing protein n=1 Tax=Rhodovibrio sodomensis TaxID=1088 RepID=A0ABS1DC72_9PROT|nr:DUF3426 domain-containing protein [Rhodovibrio sodomensis]MBK1667995.1 hypothetical protein [Rhodovibrio sodomensis]
MILACPSCGASFRLDAGKLGARGRSVRCSKCKHTWHATPEDGQDAAAGAGAQRPQPAPGQPTPGQRDRTENAGGPPPATGEGPEPGNERVLRTHASPDDGRADLRDSGVGEFETTLRASRFRPYDPAPEIETRGARGGLVLGWLLLVLTIAGVVAGGWAFREQVVAQVPQAAQIYRLAGVEVPALGAGLELRDVTRTRRLIDGRSLLVIEGRVVNTTGSPRELPVLEVALFDAAGDEVARWQVEAQTRRLGPGESTAFETRRENPPETAREFALSFAAPGDR